MHTEELAHEVQASMLQGKHELFFKKNPVLHEVQY